MSENFNNKLSMFLDLECFDVSQDEFEKVLKIVPNDYYYYDYEDNAGLIRYWFVEEREDSTLPKCLFADQYLNMLPPCFASNSSFLHSIVSEHQICVTVHCHGDYVFKTIERHIPIPTFHVSDNTLAYLKEYNASISFIPLYYVDGEEE